MCLYTSQSKPKVTSEPIRCIKMVRKRKDGSYLPYFCFTCQSTIYRIGEVTSMHCDENKIDPDYLKTDKELFEIPEKCCKGYNRYFVERGIFTFNPNNSEWKAAYHHAVLRNSTTVLLECEIPAGVKYYAGKSNCLFGEKSYASESIKVIREISIDNL